MASNIQIENTKVKDLSTEELMRALTLKLVHTNGMQFVSPSAVCKLIALMANQLGQRSD